MKSILTLIILFFSQYALAHNKVGNGGGGLRLGFDQVSLFSKFNLQLNNQSQLSEVNPLDIQNCNSPIFRSMKNDIRRMAMVLRPEIGPQLFQNLCQNGRSRYLDINNSEIKNHYFMSKVNSLTQIYQKATRYSAREIIIFAMTNPINNKTYVYPEFYKLDFIEQKVVLFHEIFWLIKYAESDRYVSPSHEIENYRKMLNLEEKTLNFILKPDDFESQRAFVIAFADFQNH